MTIVSALGQRLPHTEVVVVNEGSNDNGETVGIARSYGDQIIHRKAEWGVESAWQVTFSVGSPATTDTSRKRLSGKVAEWERRAVQTLFL
jgi:hypothetical protein